MLLIKLATLGKVWQEFRSTLPGGADGNSKEGSSLLDCICIHAGKEKRFYILDTLFWRGYDWEPYDAETRYVMSAIIHRCSFQNGNHFFLGNIG